MRALCAVVVFVCGLVCSNAAPINELPGQSRNFIPNRFDIKGTLINNDGTFTRQEIQDEQPEQSMMNQFGGEQASNLAYNQQPAYQGGQQQFQDYQEPQANFMGEQNDQNNYFNSQLAPEQNTQGYVNSPPQNDDLGGQQGEEQMFNDMTQGYQPNYNDQEPPQPELQGGQSYYSDQQPQEEQQQIKDIRPKSHDDIKGSDRDTIAKNQEKAREKTLGATKKFKVPKNLSPKDLQGMIGYSKQVYLRGGHH